MILLKFFRRRRIDESKAKQMQAQGVLGVYEIPGKMEFFNEEPSNSVYRE